MRVEPREDSPEDTPVYDESADAGGESLQTLQTLLLLGTSTFRILG